MNHEQALYLGIDIGTSGIRGIVINQHKKIIASAKADCKESSRVALRSPLQWKTMVVEVLTRLANLINLKQVIALSVDGQSGTVLLCNSKGELFGDLSRLYNDAPSQETVGKLTQDLSLCPATLGRAYELWYQSGCPKDFYIVHQADWVAALFCGRFNLSDENNALKLGYSPLKKGWLFDPEKLPFTQSALPRVSHPATFRALATTGFSREMGLSEHCQIISGTTDSTAGFIAASDSQTLATGNAVTSLGTSLVTKVISERPLTKNNIGAYSHKFGNLWISGGASNSGAGTLLEFFSKEQLAQLSKTIDPDIPSPFQYYPLLVKGERFPINDPSMESITTPRPDSDREFLAGLLESIARIEKQAYETLDDLGAPYPSIIKTVGGGSQNDVWKKIRERVLGVTIISAENPDPAYGSALIARRGASMEKRGSRATGETMLERSDNYP